MVVLDLDRRGVVLYRRSENKGADQRRRFSAADLLLLFVLFFFAYAKGRFSHAEARVEVKHHLISICI